MSSMIWKKLVRRGSVAGATVAALAAAGGGCGPVELQSGWRDHDITVDGKAGDWGNSLEFVKDLKADVGLANDDSTLYVCFVLRDEDLSRRIALSGLNLWFDPQGGKAKRFGIRFPLGRGALQRGANERGQDERRTESEPTERVSRLGDDQVEILGDSTVGPLPVDEVPGVRVAIAVSRSHALVYELAVPLQQSAENPYAIDTRPGAMLGLGLEIPALRRPERGAGAPGVEGGQGGWGRGPGGGGMMGGRGRGGMGGRGRGGMGGRASGLFEAWQVSARVKLAVPG